HPVPPPSGPDPATAHDHADRAAAEAADAAQGVMAAQTALERATLRRQESEQAARTANEAYTRLLQQAADRRQAAAVAAGRIEAARATERSLQGQWEQAGSRLAASERSAEALRAELVDYQNRLAGSLDS